MTSLHFTWRGSPVSFRTGETVAAALLHSGRSDFGRDPAGSQLRYFCGTGACQGCLVRSEGRIVEACLTPAADGAVVLALED